ncbi:MAG: hypothetical protein CL878_02035 [Dehalococcoidia bacterium]|nr:hypothetical protein [Dehalococcoidia bacterium]
MSRWFRRVRQVDVTELSPEGLMIMHAFVGPHDKWRTVWGIAQVSGLSEDTVQAYIDAHPDLFTEGDMTLGGTTIYSTTLETGRIAELLHSQSAGEDTKR